MKKLFILLMMISLFAFLVSCDNISSSKKDKDNKKEEDSESCESAFGADGVPDTDWSDGISTDSNHSGTDWSDSATESSDYTDSSADSSTSTTESSQVSILVAFRVNGGSVVNGDTVAEVVKGGVLTTLPECVREGYVLKGWSYTADGSSPWSAADAMVSDTVLYAIWEKEIETVMVVFRINGGTIVSGSNMTEVIKGDALTTFPEIEKVGYVFIGWSYAPNGIDPWEADDIFSTDTVLYAVWEEASGSTDSSNGGAEGSEDTTDSSKPALAPGDDPDSSELGGSDETTDSSNTIDSGESTTDSSNTSSSSNTTDSSTTDSSNEADSSNTTDSSDYTPDVEFPKMVTIMFDTNKAKGDEDAYGCAVSIELGSKLSYSDVPYVTYEGYTLKGWAYDPYGYELWSARNDVFETNTILFAIWEKDVTTDSSKPTEDSKPITDSSKPEEEKPSVVGIVLDANGGTIAVDYVEIEYGSKLSYSKLPTPVRVGYTLAGWAYDPYGNEMWSARNDVFTDSETTLFAIWEKDNTTDTTSSPSTDSSDTAEPLPDDEETVKIEFNTGLGYFENASDYEIVIKVGGRIPSFPTPVHDNEAMVFDGWYINPELTIPASRSTKHYADTVIYAKWNERVQCTDGSYDHVWGSWDVDTKATCTKSGTDSRYCAYCGNKDVKVGDAPLGHNWNVWEEAFMRKERSCARLGCTDKEIVEYEDVTIAVLGNTPGRQVSGNTEAFYMVPFTNMINGKWDDGYGEVVSLRGNGSAHVQFDFVAPETVDRVYFKGKGVTAVNVFVKYEGEEEFVLVGVCSSAPDKESTPFVSPDSSRKVVAVKFVEDCPPQGQSMWQEVAFVKVVE